MVPHLALITLLALCLAGPAAELTPAQLAAAVDEARGARIPDALAVLTTTTIREHNGPVIRSFQDFTAYNLTDWIRRNGPLSWPDIHEYQLRGFISRDVLLIRYTL